MTRSNTPLCLRQLPPASAPSLCPPPPVSMFVAPHTFRPRTPHRHSHAGTNDRDQRHQGWGRAESGLSSPGSGPASARLPAQVREFPRPFCASVLSREVGPTLPRPHAVGTTRKCSFALRVPSSLRCLGPSTPAVSGSKYTWQSGEPTTTIKIVVTDGGKQEMACRSPRVWMQEDTRQSRPKSQGSGPASRHQGEQLPLVPSSVFGCLPGAIPAGRRLKSVRASPSTAA